MGYANTENRSDAYVPPPKTTTIAKVGSIGIELADGGIVGTETVSKFTGFNLEQLREKVGAKIKLTFDASDSVVAVAVFPDMGNSPELELSFPPQTTKMVRVVDGCMELENGMIVDRHTIAKYTGLTPDQVKDRVGSKITLTFDSSNTIVGAAVFPDIGNGPELVFEFPPHTSTIAEVGSEGIRMADGGIVGTGTVSKFTGLTLAQLKKEVGSEVTLKFDETNTVIGVTIVDKSR